ncbi:(2Fe-2S)-binding protein [Streptomyces sp. NA02950]|uniref:(2Fe-2S)-binding protein n=1 Tax=Streptomyces sp. NA02950 TaxID=2742137 RepID=UPI0015903126|nr:(2Fe-2S)-binding protein [Streptomyces sp. NA02950]
MRKVSLRLRVNGTEHTVTVPARTSLADLLRDRLGLTGTHLGCEEGVCGACTVLVDELPVRGCLALAATCDGAEVTTVEGLTGADADRLRAAFSREGALQCGFCTPGMLITAYDLVRRHAAGSAEDIRAALSGNLCRCTGYQAIVRAVASAAAEAEAAAEAPEAGEAGEAGAATGASGTSHASGATASGGPGPRTGAAHARDGA